MKTTFILMLFSLSCYAQIEVKATRDTNLIDSMSVAFAKTVEVIKAGQSIRITGYSRDYYVATAGQKQGYIYYPYLSEVPQADEYRQMGLKREAAEMSQIRLRELRARFGKDAEKILNKQIWIGMTKAMAVASIGSAQSINSSTTASGESEQWVYDTKYLYFDNDVLTSWQEKKK